MEKNVKLSTTNLEFIKGTLDNLQITTSMNLRKINEVNQMLERATQAIIKPVVKIKKHYSKELNNYKLQYAELTSKLDSKLEQINDKTNNDPDLALTMNLIEEEIQMNENLLKDHSSLVDLMHKMSEMSAIFNNLFNTHEFSRLVQSFNIEHINGTVKTKKNLDDSISVDNDSIDLNESKKKNLGKKRKREMNGNAEVEENGNAQVNSSSKKIKKKKQISANDNDEESNDNGKKKRMTDTMLLDNLKKKFASSGYVGKISKTFLSRRLFKKLTYKHEFDYAGEEIKETRTKSSGETTNYKYAKLSIILEDENKFSVKFLIENTFKNSVMVKKGDEVTYIGKLNIQLNDFLENLKQGKLRKEFGISQITLEFYEFFEELISEIDLKQSEVLLNNIEENYLVKLLNDWNELSNVREYVKDIKGK